MAQDNTYEDIFSTDNNLDVELFDEEYDTSSLNKDTENIIPASDEDKKNAKATGNANKPQEQKEVKEPEKVIYDELAEGTEVDNTTPGSETTTEPLSEMASISEGLFKAGIWSRDDDEDTTNLPDTQEDFAERFDYETRKRAHNYVAEVAGRHGEDAEEAFNAIYVKGVPIKEYLSKWQQNQDFKSMDLSIEENQVNVIETIYKNQGIPEDKIREKIRKLRLSEDLEDEANTYHGVLIKRQEEELKQIEENSRIKLEQQKLNKQQFATTIENVFSEKLKTQDFDGIPVNSKSAEIAKDILRTEKWKLKDGTLATDWDRIMMDLQSPMNYETKMKLALLFEPYVSGKPLKLKLDSVGKKAVSNQTTQLFNLGNKGSKRTVPQNSTTVKKELVDLSDL